MTIIRHSGGRAKRGNQESNVAAAEYGFRARGLASTNSVKLASVAVKLLE
jgi:hypothetical protein